MLMNSNNIYQMTLLTNYKQKRDHSSTTKKKYVSQTEIDSICTIQKHQIGKYVRKITIWTTKSTETS